MSHEPVGIVERLAASIAIPECMNGPTFYCIYRPLTNASRVSLQLRPRTKNARAVFPNPSPHPSWRSALSPSRSSPPPSSPWSSQKDTARVPGKSSAPTIRPAAVPVHHSVIPIFPTALPRFSCGSPNCPDKLKIKLTEDDDTPLDAKRLVPCTGSGNVDLQKTTQAVGPKGNAFHEAIKDNLGADDSAFGGGQTGWFKCGKLTIPANTYWMTFSPELPGGIEVNPSGIFRDGADAAFAGGDSQLVTFENTEKYMIIGDLCMYKLLPSPGASPQPSAEPRCSVEDRSSSRKDEPSAGDNSSSSLGIEAIVCIVSGVIGLFGLLIAAVTLYCQKRSNGPAENRE